MSGLLLRASWSGVARSRVASWVSRLALQAALAGALVVALPDDAVAQTAEEVAGARELARQGAEAFAAGEWQQAHDYFERAESLFHAPPHLLYMARSKEKLGELVEALELYNKIVREQLDSTAPRAFVDAQESAAEEMKAIEPRLARVTVTLEGPGADRAEVLANGKPVPAALLGVPRPMDPGTYEFTVVAEGAEAEPVVVTIDAGARESVTLRLTAVEAAPLAPPPPAAEPADSGSSPVPAYVALGAGAVALGVGTFFLIDHLGKKGDADDLFNDRGCALDGACTVAEQNEIKDLSSEAATSGTLSIVGFGVGAAAVGAGLFLLLTNDSSTETARQHNEPHVRPVLGWRSVGLSGRF
ncbi:MAG: hypothetical protein GX607_15340 [Myxococcales bacterium]|nr:hypothetical protein [Myxococcales bacterium]